MSNVQTSGNLSTAKAIYGLLICLLFTTQCGVIVLSWLLKAIWPEWNLRPLLSEEGVRWLFGQFTSNILSPLLAWLLLGICAWSAFRGSHLLDALQRIGTWNFMSYRERLARRCVFFEVITVVMIMVLLTLPSHAILLNISGSLYPSSFSVSIFAVICLTTIATSLTYSAVCEDGDKKGSIYYLLVGSADYYWPLPLYFLARQLWCMVVYVWW